MNLPALSIDALSAGTVARVGESLFYWTTTGEEAREFPLNVQLGFDAKNQVLLLEFELMNDQFVEQNSYTDDNSALWKQEVFEWFISPGAHTPERYMEIQVNPNGALFAAWVTNPNGTGTENAVELFDGYSVGMKVSVIKQNDSWRGEILLPLSVFGDLPGEYRLNFFRIVSLQSHERAEQWACTATSCAFLAWSPTFSGATPAFHIPEYFGHLNIEYNIRGH